MALDFAQRRFTVDEYERMAELGIIGRNEKLELIDGTIVVVPPSGEAHGGGINRLTHLFVTRFAGRAIVQPQLPVRLGEHGLPEPDLALLRPESSYYAHRRPQAADAIAFVELSDANVAFDRGAKLRAYARSRIPEYWIVNVRDHRIVCHRGPSDVGYTKRFEAFRGDRLAFAAFPRDTFAAEEILPTVRTEARPDR